MSDPYANTAQLRTPPELPRSSGKLTRRLVVFGAIALVTVPVLARFAPQEISRWYLAAAQNAVGDGRLPDALRLVDSALSWSPNDPAVLFARAGLRRDAKDFEGSLEDYDTLVRLAEDETIDDQDVVARAARSIVYQRLGRHREAIADWDYITDYRRQEHEARGDFESQEQYGLSLNNGAYARALGNLEIARGLRDIQLAFEVLNREDDHTLLDTQGYLYYLDGQMKPALEKMEAAVQLGAGRNAQFAQNTGVEIRKLEQRRPLRAPKYVRYYEASLQAKLQEMAVLLHHRGLVYQALGQASKAANDLQRAEKLGYNPAEGVW